MFDEIQCGFGRTGTLFAFQQSGVVPDIITLAKPIGGGLPLGCVLTGDAIEGVVKPGHHGTTFGGNPIACRLGIAVLEEIESSNLLERVRNTGAWFGSELQALRSRNESVVAVRGMGLMWGIELDRPAGPVAAKLLAHGFVVGTARENVLRLLPPYIVPKRALSEFLIALEQVLSVIPTLNEVNGRDLGAGRHKEQPIVTPPTSPDPSLTLGMTLTQGALTK